MQCTNCRFPNSFNDVVCYRCGTSLESASSGNVDAEPESVSEERAGLWYLKQILLFPFRLIGLALLLIFLPGLYYMWQLPTTAKQNEVDLSLLALRAVNKESAVRPLAHLGHRGKIIDKMADLTPTLSAAEEGISLVTITLYNPHTIRCESKRTQEGQHEHTVHFSTGDGRKVTTTTPHLDVPQEEIDDAHEQLSRLFPQPKQWDETLEWGQALFVSLWIEKNELRDLHRDLVPKPFEGTGYEHLWLVWFTLCGDNNPEARKELHHLPELFQKAFPKAEDQTAALAWAKALYEHMEKNFDEYRKLIQGQQSKYSRPSSNDRDHVLSSLPRVLPPKTRWTYLWLLYRYVGLSEASRQAARQHWLKQFPSAHQQRVLEFGQSLVQLRRQAGEPLPAVPETLPLVCVVQRLKGTDSSGEKLRKTLAEHYGPKDQFYMHFSLVTAYPNDDLFYLMASNDSLGMHAFTQSREKTLEKKVFGLFGMAFLVVLMSLGMTTAFRLVGFWVLSADARVLWRKHTQGRGKEPLWLWVSSVVALSAVGAVLAPYTLPPEVGIQLHSFQDLFLGALAATLVGGLLIATCRRILSIYLVAFGVDIETTWADEILAVLFGGFILYHFGNGWLSITFSALADVVPGVVLFVLSQLRKQQPEVPSLPMRPVSRAAPVGS